MWKAKRKLLEVERVTSHSAGPSPFIAGRTPQNTAFSFTPAELYGAMAQCSSRAKMDQRAARAQVEFCRHLIAHHVDEKADRFAVLDSARDLKDYVAKAMTGLVGDGIAYLQMVRDGYRWIDHFERHTVIGKMPTRRSPDFIFSRSNDQYVALAESKATKGTSKAAFDKRVEDGYRGQVEPYLGHKIDAWVASHGFAVGSWMTSPTKAEVFLHHTAPPVSATPDDDGPSGPSDPSGVRFGNYCGVITLLFGPDVGEATRARLWRPSQQTFTTVEWLGRRWIVGEDLGADAVLFSLVGELVFRRTSFRSFNGMAIDLEIARRVFAFIEADAPDARMFEEIAEVPPELIELAREAGGALFPDGLAVLGRDVDLSRIEPGFILPGGQVFAQPAQKEKKIEVTETVAGSLVDRASDVEEVETSTEESRAMLHLTRE
ncbi:hypothetical protein [Shinella sumterensis]|uniref:hypothetical protein n=1 Tax=Shinella sumterensis TaxID=1967501 RepID=UPI003F841AAE